jgi:hypothetical protein
MLHRNFLLLVGLLAVPLSAQPPVAAVSHSGGTWTIAGKKNQVTLDEANLAIAVHAGPVTWKMLPSSDRDLTVNAGGETIRLRLADAKDIRIAPYHTGFASGLRITLDGFRNTGQRDPGGNVDLRLALTMCLEDGSEDLLFEAVANENRARVRELNWPQEMDGRDVDYTVISSDDGTLLPRDWPKPYNPGIRAAGETTVLQSHVVETWSMSWWGFEKGDSAMMVIVETPDDAGYTFSHPAGGPTHMGPSWRAQLDRFAYPRRLRMSFLPKGNYVDLCKRYRRYVMDSGLFVSLNEKIACDPLVKNLIGSPFVGMSVLRQPKPGTGPYDAAHPERNHRLTTFAQNIERLRNLRAQGFAHVNVSLSGWPRMGYDREIPDVLPPPEAAGGWAGMKSFFDACRELGDTCWLHDQYRDYYADAPSFNLDMAVHEEDQTSPPKAFPGTRFQHDWKDGYVPLMNHWDGGAQGYLNSGFMLGFVERNYRMMFEHGIHPQGSYQDVFGYVTPDQDFNPNHPNTRGDSVRYRAGVLAWVRHNLGIVGTEDGSDWVMPYADYVTDRLNRSPSTGTDPDHEDAIEVPLYELVYHDAIVTTYSPSNLRGLLHASAPNMRGDSPAALAQVKRMAALHARVGTIEMTNHEFLDPQRRRERTTFADGTTVTVDWQAGTAGIKPELNVR